MKRYPLVHLCGISLCTFSQFFVKISVSNGTKENIYFYFANNKILSYFSKCHGSHILGRSLIFLKEDFYCTFDAFTFKFKKEVQNLV